MRELVMTARARELQRAGKTTPRRGFDFSRAALGIVVPATILLVWQAAVTIGNLPESRLPSPASVVDASLTWVFGPQEALGWSSGTWAPYALMSLRRVLIGFAIAASAGVVVGIVTGWYALMSHVFDPWLNFMRAVPMTAWVPFAVFFFGIQEPAAIFLIALGAFFPIAINTASGTRQTPQILIRAALMLGTKPHKLLWNVVLPAALPSILTGLRVGVGLAWVLVIVAEMLAVQGGLGYALWTAYQYARLDIIIASIITVGAFGLASDRLLLIVGNRALRWQRGLISPRGS